MPPVTGSRLESLLAVLGSREVADLEGEVVIEAAGAARKMVDGMVDVAGWHSVGQSASLIKIMGNCGTGWRVVPLSVRGAIVRDSENILDAVLCVQSR